MKNRVVGNRAGFGRRRAARLWWVARAGPARASSGPGSLIQRQLEYTLVRAMCRLRATAVASWSSTCTPVSNCPSSG